MKIVFFGVDHIGHTNPTLPLVKRLTERGHVVGYCLPPEWGEVLESMGATLLNRGGAEDFSTSEYHPSSRWPYQIIPAAARLAPLLLPEIREFEPDIIIHDSFALWGYLIARKLEVQSLASISTFVIPDLAECGIDADEIRRDPTNRRAADAIEADFSFRPEWDDLAWFYGQRGLVYSIPSINQNRDETLDFVGAMVPHDKDFSDEARAFLGDRDSTRPLVYISMGTLAPRTLGLGADFFRVFVAAARLRTECDFILSVSRSVDPGALGLLPGNLRVCQYVPQLAVLSRASAFVTHAGANSIHEAFFFGVPLVCVPCFADQHFNARLVMDHGAGTVLHQPTLQAEQVARAIGSILQDEQVSGNLRRLKAEVRRAGGPLRAAEVVEEAMDNPSVS